MQQPQAAIGVATGSRGSSWIAFKNFELLSAFADARLVKV